MILSPFLSLGEKWVYFYISVKQTACQDNAKHLNKGIDLLYQIGRMIYVKIEIQRAESDKSI